MKVIVPKAAREYVLANYPNDPLLKHIALSLLEQMPKAETQEVIRCKDCASGKGATHKVCPLYRDGLMKDDDFCSVGERKDND